MEVEENISDTDSCLFAKKQDPTPHEDMRSQARF